MTLFDEQDPFPEKMFIYKCTNCDDSAIYVDREGAFDQCMRHEHKSHDCKTEHMSIAVYQMIEHITDVDKVYYEELMKEVK